MMDKDKKGYIRFLFNQNKQTISQISREVNLSRLTVRRILNNDNEQRKRKKRVSKLDSYKEEIQYILTQQPALSNILILQRLKQKGYQGGRSILSDYLLALRRKDNQAYLNIRNFY